MNKLFIALFGALALMVSASGQARQNEEIFNRLDNDANYQNMNADEQEAFEAVLDKSLNIMEERGLNFTDANAQMFIIDSITKFLGLSKAKEEAKKAGAMPPEGAVASNNLDHTLVLTDASGQYFILDTVTGIIGKVVNTVSGIFGGGKDKAAPAAAPATIFNSLEDSLSLDANVQYGATWDAIKDAARAIGSAVGDAAGAIKDKAQTLIGKAAGAVAAGAGMLSEKLAPGTKATLTVEAAE